MIRSAMETGITSASAGGVHCRYFQIWLCRWMPSGGGGPRKVAPRSRAARNMEGRDMGKTMVSMARESMPGA